MKVKGNTVYPATIMQAVKDPEDGKNVKEKLSELASKLKGVTFRSEIDYSKATERNGINSQGVISTVALSEYKVAKILIEKKGLYYISTPGSSSQQTMWKYTDSTYSTPEKQIISNKVNPYADFINLEIGYYAICWNSNTEVAKLTPFEDIITLIDDYVRANVVKKDSVYYNELFFGVKEIGKYITSQGVISNATSSYKTIKIYLYQGRYMLDIATSGSGRGMWKYTDSTYSTPEKEIVGNVSSQKYVSIDLEGGYYAVCWADDNYPRLLNVKTLLYVMDEHIIEELPFVNSFANEDIVSSKYIGDEGVVKSAASSSYKIAYIKIEESGNYWIDRKEGGYYDIMWKYTDGSYKTPEKVIIRGVGELGTGLKKAIRESVYLESGYYILSFVGENNACSLTKYHKLSEIYNYGLKKNTSFGISDFSLFSSAGEWSADKNEVSNKSEGMVNAFHYDIKTYEQEYDMSVNITPKSLNGGVFEFALGKYYSESVNTFVSFECDGTSYNGGLIFDSMKKQTISLSSLDCGIGKTLNIRIVKKATNHIVYDVIFTDAHGKTVVLSDIRGYGSKEGDGKLGGSWGYMSVYANKGTATFSNPRFGYPKNMNDLKVLVVGHSFIEASTIDVTDGGMQNSLANLIKDEIGEKDVCVFGQGGASASTVLPYIDRVTDWCMSAQYCIIFLGYNDNEAALMSVGKDMQEINTIVKNKGIKPIWLTITENRDNGQVKPNLNQFIKDNFDYIDIVPYSYNNDGSVDKSVFLDSVHPSAEGHKRIFNIIRCQRPDMFNVSSAK